MERARLLRLREPQREGDLPALHGLVRRQPGAPLAAPAGGGRHALRGRDGRRRPRAGADARAPSRRATCAGPRSWATSCCSRRRTTRRARRSRRTCWSSWASASENGTWRCVYLAGATELRSGNFGTPAATASADMHAGALAGAGLRRHRDPRGRPEGLGPGALDRRGPGRLGRAVPARPAQRRPGPPRRRPWTVPRSSSAPAARRCPGCSPARWTASRWKGTSRSWASCWASSRRPIRTSTSSRRSPSRPAVDGRVYARPAHDPPRVASRGRC